MAWRQLLFADCNLSPLSPFINPSSYCNGAINQLYTWSRRKPVLYIKFYYIGNSEDNFPTVLHSVWSPLSKKTKVIGRGCRCFHAQPKSFKRTFKCWLAGFSNLFPTHLQIKMLMLILFTKHLVPHWNWVLDSKTTWQSQNHFHPF